MRRFRLLTALLAASTSLAGLADTAGATLPVSSSGPRLIAFRAHFGGGFGRRSVFGGGFGRRRGVFGSRRGRSRGFLHNVARFLAFSFLLHLFFSHGGLSILLWLIVIGLVVHFVRRRRRRYAY